jgi:hypothetical protein
MIKQISLIAIVAIGIGVLFLGTLLAPVFATVPADCTGDPHNGFRNPDTGNPHVGGFGGAATGNPHVDVSGCPGSK